MIRNFALITLAALATFIGTMVPVRDATAATTLALCQKMYAQCCKALGGGYHKCTSAAVGNPKAGDEKPAAGETVHGFGGDDARKIEDGKRPGNRVGAAAGQRGSDANRAGTPPVSASTPDILGVAVECQVINGQRHTVRVLMKYPGSGAPFYRFAFRNSVTHQTSNFAANRLQTNVTAPLPAGNYDLTVAFSNDGSQPLAGSAEALWNNIKVLPTVSTGGKGTGCAFEIPANRPDRVDPLKAS